MQKKKIFIIIAVFILFGVLIGSIVFFTRSLGKTSVKIKESQDELSKRASSLAVLAKLKLDYSKSAQNYLNVLYNVLPIKDELIDFPKEIQSAGLVVSEDLDIGFSFLGENSPTEQELGSVSFSLSLKGEMEYVLNFLNKLQELPYIMKFNNLSILDNGTEVKSDIRGKVFFRTVEEVKS